MSETVHHDHNSESFETEDLSPQGVFFFMAGLAIVGVVIYFIILGMYRYLDAYDWKHQPATSPMALSTGIDLQTMTRDQILQKAEATFPKPVLEYSEQTQYTNELERQDQVLESYDWVDQENGVVRIPIEQAIDLLAQRGLPVLPQGEAARAASTTKTGTKLKTGKAAQAQ